MKKKITPTLLLLLLLFPPNSGYCAEESEKSQNEKLETSQVKDSEEFENDFRFRVVSGLSFNSTGRFNGHLLTKAEFGYGFWLKPWFRLGPYLAPYWQDFNGGTTTAIEGGVDISVLFLKKKLWSLGVDISEGILSSNKDFPKENTYRFNFSNNVGPMFRYMIRENYSLSLGYRFSHYSNAGIKKAGIKSFNPGINYHSVVLGICYYF